MGRERLRMAGVFAIVCVLFSLPVLAQQGRGQRGIGRGRMGNFMFIERSWAIVCFGIGALQEQINKLRPAYEDAWNTRAEAVNKLRAAEDRRAAFQEFAQTLEMIRTDLERKLASVLTKEQQEKLQQMLQAGWFGSRGRGRGR